MTGRAALEQGRDAYTKRAWLNAYESLAAAEGHAALDAPDVDLLATCAFMLGRDDESVEWLERAHQRYLASGETLRGVRCALWIGLNLASRGQIGPATGWLGRAQRLLENEGECRRARISAAAARCSSTRRPATSLLRRRRRRRPFESARASATETCSRSRSHGQGYMLIKDGQSTERPRSARRGDGRGHRRGALADRHGLVYCGVILACQEVYEARRAREWTRALSDWWALQPEMVAFTGRCLVHRAEILQLDGAWPDALEESRRAGERFARRRIRRPASPAYRLGELLRLQGEFAAAEEAYREASGFGWEPQPGLAQLRLAQGRADAAVAAIRRAEAATSLAIERARLLPAFVEIMLAVGEHREREASLCRAAGARARLP